MKMESIYSCILKKVKSSLIDIPRQSTEKEKKKKLFLLIYLSEDAKVHATYIPFDSLLYKQKIN